MTETKNEPRFINNTAKLVYVLRPDGTQRVVRPYRELDSIVGRVEDDCVVCGDHYAQFEGLLERFPEPDPSVPTAVEDLDPMDPGDPSLAARAAQGTFKGTGDVVAPDGTIKRSGSDTEEPGEGDDPVDPSVEAVIDDETDFDQDEESDDEEVDETEDEEVDEDEDGVPEDDAELTAVDGIGPKLAENLAEIGVETAAALADMQEDDQIEKLRQVAGVRNAKHARQLVASAQELLGWE